MHAPDFERSSFAAKPTPKLEAIVVHHDGTAWIKTFDLVREEPHTCYLGDRSHLHEWAYG